MHPPAAAPKPNRFRITSVATFVHVVTWPPPGHSSELVVRLAVEESHAWLGIGGGAGSGRELPGRRRSFSKESSMVFSTSGPDHLRRGDRCRDFIREMTTRKLGGEYNDLFAFKQWDAAVPGGVEAEIGEEVARAQREDGCTFEVVVDVALPVELFYSEGVELLHACAVLAAGDLTTRGRPASGGDGAVPSCSICLEEMTREADAMQLPGCAHRFHYDCIGKWFTKASTCPVCRRDKFQYLPPEYRALRDTMRSEPEVPC